jgi:predicted nucleic acid-binding protein
MRTTVTLDDKLVESLRESTGIKETSALVRQALVEMRQRVAAERLAAMGGTLPNLKAPPPFHQYRMIIVDTSIWVDHFRRRQSSLASLIAEGNLALHPYVLGELALGGLPPNGPMIDELMELARPPVASAVETQAFIAWAELAGTGIGYVDTHLLLSARLTVNGRVLTRDKRLHAQAERLGIALQS